MPDSFYEPIYLRGDAGRSIVTYDPALTQTIIFPENPSPGYEVDLINLTGDTTAVTFDFNGNKGFWTPTKTEYSTWVITEADADYRLIYTRAVGPGVDRRLWFANPWPSNITAQP